MRLPRAFLPGAAPGASIEVHGAPYHHLVRVLRRGPGAPLVALDGQGGAFKAAIESIDPSRGALRVRVGEPAPDPPPDCLPLAVALGVPRGDGFETAVRWGSEMGLARLLPLRTARTVVRIPPQALPAKLERWRRIARESAEQCRRPTPLEVEPLVSLPDLLARAEAPGCRWIAVPGSPGIEEAGLLDALAGARGGSPAPVLVVAGPEGGFDADELARTVEAGFQPVGFPTPILRTPTVVPYLAALASVARWMGDAGRSPDDAGDAEL